MRRFVLVLFSFVLVLSAVPESKACGDKVLALGRAVKLRYVSAHSASILLYMHAAPLAAALADPSLQSALKKSSQVIKVVQDSAELNQALERGKYDLVVADAADADSIEKQLLTMSSHTVVVPVLNQGTKAEASALAKRYHVVIKTPGKTGSYYTALDEAMDLKAKRDEVKVVAVK